MDLRRRLMPCLVSLLGCHAAWAGSAWEAYTVPGEISGKLEPTVMIRDPVGGGSLVIQCDGKDIRTYVAVNDDMHVFFNHGEQAEILDKIGDGPTLRHLGTLSSVKDGRAILEVDAPGFIDRLKDGEIRMLVQLHNGRYGVFLDASDTARSLAPVKACRA